MAPASTRGETMTSTVTTPGRFFDDFAVGDVYRCRYGRTVSEAENILFTLQTNNTNQIHFNREYGARTPYRQCLVNSTLTLAIVTGMGVSDISENGIALGWDEVRLPNPLFPGDTLYSESKVISVRESRSHPDRGIVTLATRGYNQHGDVVIQFKRTVMVWKRTHAPVADSGFPTTLKEAIDEHRPPG
jgi:itaconyl-CoA hydratase